MAIDGNGLQLMDTSGGGTLIVGANLMVMCNGMRPAGATLIGSTLDVHVQSRFVRLALVLGQTQVLPS